MAHDITAQDAQDDRSRYTLTIVLCTYYWVLLLRQLSLQLGPHDTGITLNWTIRAAFTAICQDRAWAIPPSRFAIRESVVTGDAGSSGAGL